MSWRHVISALPLRKCVKCDGEFKPRAFLHKYCDSCGTVIERKHKLRWQREHDKKCGREPKARGHERRVTRNAAIKEFGAARSTELSKGPSLLAEQIKVARSISIETPFDGLFSKNAAVTIGTASGKPYVFVRREVKQKRENLALLVREKLRGVKWPTGKTYLDILVQKPTHRYDAVNVVDTICDGIKVGLGLDDRWFSISRLDWEIVKLNPMLFVTISTPHDTDHNVCCTCGQLLSLESFTKHSESDNGVHTICRFCTTHISTAKKSALKTKKAATYLPGFSENFTIERG